MKWIRVNEYQYVNEDQLREIQFVSRGQTEWFYRLFYNNGNNVDIKGFDSLEDAFDSANRTFGLTGVGPGSVIEYEKLEKPMTPPKSTTKSKK